MSVRLIMKLEVAAVERVAADISVFDLVQGNFSLVDSQGEMRKATQKIVPALSLRGGRIP
jgi:predicted amidohydrolase